MEAEELPAHPPSGRKGKSKAEKEKEKEREKERERLEKERLEKEKAEKVGSIFVLYIGTTIIESSTFFHQGAILTADH